MLISAFNRKDAYQVKHAGYTMMWQSITDRSFRAKYSSFSAMIVEPNSQQ